MAQKRLSAVSLPASWTTLIGARAGALTTLDGPRPLHHLMGITGFAFRIDLTVSAGVLAAAPAAAALDIRRALPLLRNAGRKLDLILASRAALDFSRQRERALKAIRKSIDRGRPAIAYDLHLPEFGLIDGYDDRARTLTVASLLSSQYGPTLAESRWPVPERDNPLIVLIPGGRERVDPARAHAAALRFALEHAEHGDLGDPTGAVHGLAAYACWREWFAAGRPVDPPGHARTLQTVLNARRDAARYLRDAAAGQPDRTERLPQAAAAYDRVALALSRMATLFPYPAGGDPTSAAARIVASGALREAEELEREALQWLDPTR
jgi:hypothetical protein